MKFNIKKILKKFKQLFSACLVDDYKNILLYICGNEALPMPLDADEERILLEEMENCNEEAKSKLVEHNLRLVVYIAKKFESSGIPLEDLISIGAIGLIKAVSTYKYDKKIKLATYASRCIENEILMQLRKDVKKKAEVSLDEPLNEDGDGNELLLIDILATEDDALSENMDKMKEKELLWKSIERLEEREREIMVMRFGLQGNEEKTQKEVADSLGISQSYISRIEKKILNKMKKDLEKSVNL